MRLSADILFAQRRVGQESATYARFPEHNNRRLKQNYLVCPRGSIPSAAGNAVSWADCRGSEPRMRRLRPPAGAG